MRSAPILCALALSVSACASGTYVAGPQPAAIPPAATGSTFRAPPAGTGTGVAGVTGAGADALTSRFGAARIDLSEGDARKLQFAAPGCVLDIFLYPREAGGVPVATHIDARRRQGGTAIDNAACIAEIEGALR